MRLDRGDVEAGLKKKGFVFTDGDHRFYTLHIDGKKTGISTKVSRGTSHKDIGDTLLAEMAKQLRIKKSEFVELVRCPLDREKYIALLRERGTRI